MMHDSNYNLLKHLKDRGEAAEMYLGFKQQFPQVSPAEFSWLPPPAHARSS